MIGNKDAGTITFYYDSDKLFNDVSLMSAYLAKNWAESETSVDEYSITEDERELYTICVKQAFPNVYEEMIKLSSGIDNAFNDDVVIETKEESGLRRDAGKYLEINIVNNNAYNSNVLNLVDATILDCLKYCILSEFYTLCLNAGLQKIAYGKFINSLSQLKNRLFQLKKK